MNKIINPPCNSLKQGTPFIMVDEKKKVKKSRVVVRGESSRPVESSGAAPDVSVSPFGQFLPDPPLCVRLLSVKRRGDEWTRRAQRLTMSQRSSLWVDLCQLFVSRRESRSRRQLGGLASFQRRTMLLILLGYRFVSFQASRSFINFLLGCHTGQLFDPLS